MSCDISGSTDAPDRLTPNFEQFAFLQSITSKALLCAVFDYRIVLQLTSASCSRLCPSTEGNRQTTILKVGSNILVKFHYDKKLAES